MKLALSHQIPKIDGYITEQLGISQEELIDRSGSAVARAIISLVPKGARLIFFCGKGNNGADGYSAAHKLMKDYKVTAYDVFGEGQKSIAGKNTLKKYISDGGEYRIFELNKELKEEIKSASCIVDAIFGTGFEGELPEEVRALSFEIGRLVGAVKIAIDVPLGVSADTGAADICTSSMSATVELSFMKPGILSYPAKTYVGKVIHDDLGLPLDKINEKFKLSYNYIDEGLACSILPKREENSSKGSFGKALLITGSDKYKGAAALSLEAALRGGAGYVTYVGNESICTSLCAKLPEAIYKTVGDIDKLSLNDMKEITELSAKAAATLIGSGSDNTEGLYRLVCALLESEGGVLILDADAINSLSHHLDEALERIKNSRRRVVLTPHPLEFSRLSGTEVSLVQQNRLSCAISFAAENKCILVLKGAGTIVTDGQEVYINSSGSSALAKAGSGDVLSGLITSIAASGAAPMLSAALAVYLHGKAADTAIDELSTYGVTPSDLPVKIAGQMAVLEKKAKICK